MKHNPPPIHHWLALLIFVPALASISQAQSTVANTGRPAAQDIHSFGQPGRVRVEHLDLDLDVDFEKKVLAGRASLRLKRIDPQAHLVLDTRDLTIRDVYLADGKTPAKFQLAQPRRHLGAALTIELPDDSQTIHIDYQTSPTAKALQWLSPQQTASGQLPFMFSQSQSILARTWIPCQDSPGIRMTYSATVRVPVTMLAVMSAENPQAKNGDGIYKFKMTQPIPSYLLALAVGDLQFRALGPRSGIYAEPSIVESAAWEFAQTERMLSAAEQLYGPYRWDRYDILVLPPSFPFGGMENPRLTFATPTVLAGDRSLVALIAHELAHSWSGNLVTNATWNDFWLNEGFTVYFEHRIMEAVNGRPFDEMWARLNKDALLKEMAGLPPRETWLYLDLAGRDPDEGSTDVAYEKGYLFLRMLEEAVGRDKWDPFLRSYFDKFAFQSMTTAGFLEYLHTELLDDEPDATTNSLQIEQWVYGPGLPSNEPTINANELYRVESQASRFLNGTSVDLLETDGWTTHHWLHFLRRIKRPMTNKQMQQLDSRFKFTSSGNSEILHDWLLHAIAANYQPAMPALEDFMTRQGRRKFLTPLYRELIRTNTGRKRAELIYAKARTLYHPVTVETMDQLLGWR